MVGMVTRDIKLWEEFLGLCGRCYNNTDFKCHRSEARACLIGVYVCVVEVFFLSMNVYMLCGLGGYGCVYVYVCETEKCVYVYVCERE